jgi:hypothetical protein
MNRGHLNRTRRLALATLASALTVGSLLAVASPASANAGHGPKLAKFRIEPDIANFGTLFTGQTSDPIVFTVSNVGQGTTNPLVTSIDALLGPDQFGIVQDSCAGVQLTPFTSCTVSVVYHPHGQFPFAIGSLDIGNGIQGCCPPGTHALFSGRQKFFKVGGPTPA